MRASVIASLFLIALVALGLRGGAVRSHLASAQAQNAPPVSVKKGKEIKNEIGRGEPQAPFYKKEIAGEPFSSPTAARQDALKAAARDLAVHLQARDPSYRYEPTARFLLENRLVDEGMMEEQDLSGPDAPKMFRNKLTLEVPMSKVSALLEEDRRERSVERLGQAGRGLAGLVVMLVALVGYFRLDDWTKGYLSTALKFTAIALAAAGAIALWWII